MKEFVILKFRNGRRERERERENVKRWNEGNG